ncbi:polysaccharide biosynthesis protein [Flavobacterium piscinae]|uniref:Polysaccharide biosynthesis protein n=1 Tax=Flavobacterium piscinae TaxID=2506424 RepID=A0A4V1N4R5_9FLAO|nr:N-acetylneuraminate synthase family protein [Flavobacterium piscinae]RXR33086.1 polysaccharide biosynthesis protein [Flavobacterium piscinae]
MKVHLSPKKEVYNFCEPYIIAEIGANHNGDMDLAKKMIDSAVECGCDAVKFQSWTPKSLIAKEEYDRNQSYDDSPKKHFGSLKEMVERYYLRDDQHVELKEYCKTKGVDFCSSPFSNEEVDLLVKLDVPFLKIASMDINNIPFLKYAAKTMKPLVISTGMSTLSEIETAVNTVKAEGNNNIVLLHCISIYPPKDKDIHLRNITMLQQAFDLPIGFSDHSFGASIPLASVALGACIIEKHFTLDKDLPGWDHEISANPVEMKTICEDSKKIAAALGNVFRTVSDEEEQKKSKFRRSIVLEKALKKGDIIKESDLAYKRPGTGIPPNEFLYVIGRKVNQDLEIDSVLNWNCFE